MQPLLRWSDNPADSHQMCVIVSYNPKYGQGNYASTSNRTASHKDLLCKLANLFDASWIILECSQLICWQPPFLLMYRLQPGHLFANRLIIFSDFLSSSVGLVMMLSPNCSQVWPACQGTLCSEQELKPHALQVARFEGFRGSGSSGCSCPNEQPGPRHHLKFGSSCSRACRVVRSSYLSTYQSRALVLAATLPFEYLRCCKFGNVLVLQSKVAYWTPHIIPNISFKVWCNM